MPFGPSTITPYSALHTAISLPPVMIGLDLHLTKGTINFNTTSESLTRLRLGHPLSPSPEALELVPVRGLLLVALRASIWLQRRADKTEAPPLIGSAGRP